MLETGAKHVGGHGVYLVAKPYARQEGHPLARSMFYLSLIQENSAKRNERRHQPLDVGVRKPRWVTPPILRGDPVLQVSRDELPRNIAHLRHESGARIHIIRNQPRGIR